MHRLEKLLWAAWPLLILTIFAACSARPNEDSEFKRSVLRARRERDQVFKSGDSPIPEEDKARFQGLAYFDVNPGLRFKVKLNRYPNPQNIRLGTNTGEIRSGLRYGYFEFQVSGKTCRLQVYRLDDAQDAGAPNLFIPFRDVTSGKESYGSGRYLDLHENTSGMYELDFNQAYNPSCAYGRGGYSCPIPPAENTLPVLIAAGEKAYPLAREHH